MQSFKFIRKFEPVESFRTNKIIGMFDLHPNNYIQTFTGELNTPNEWNIGLIVGRSGTGKSTIANEFYKPFETTYTNKPIVDEMPDGKTVEEITQMFSLVGLSSPPNWLKPYNVLSNGEKMRCDLAKALLQNDDMIIFDEFTSVVDRDVAKVVSMVVQKSVRRQNRKFIAVTCHYDVTEWLEPDWIFSTDEMKTIDVKKNDLQLTSIFTKQQQTSGQCLKSIII